MFITGGKVLLGNSLVDTNIRIEGAQFASTSATPLDGEQTLDAAGCYVVPGFIDLHFHGCNGHDFCEGTLDSISAIAKWEALQGVTSICPATMSYPESTLAPIMEAAAAYTPAADEASLVGINMEGPFLSLEKAGAQNPAYIQAPDAEMFMRLQQHADGLIKIVDVAPEEPGALGFIQSVSSAVRVSIAHTTANYETAMAAISAGAKQLTHVCNAMPAFLHREPGPIGAAFDDEAVAVEVIADGVHLHPAMVRALFRLFGPDRVILISDSMEAAGLEDGIYALGGQQVQVAANKATLEDGTIAGSVTSLSACVKNAVCNMGIDFIAAVQAATINPARALGIDDKLGTIEPGKVANCVVLDDDLNIVHVVVRGQLLY